MTMLSDLIKAKHPQRIGEHLDALDHKGRVRALSGLGLLELGPLYHAVEGAQSHDMSHYVPEGRGPLEEVVHWGRNSLPVFRYFEKRFCRPSDPESTSLYGYNAQWYGQFTGPGYFTAVPGWPSDPVVINYLEPAKEKAPGWPDIVTRHGRLGRFIYKNTTDRMRKVSEHVTVGAGYRNEQPVGVFFVLCRVD